MTRIHTLFHWNPTRLFAGLASCLILLMSATTAARASVVLDKVWFPNGVIRVNWREAPTPPTTNQNLAFGYMNGHTPLRISQSPSNSNLDFRWSGGNWNVARGYWQPNGSDLYGKSLAFRGPDSSTAPSEPNVLTIVHELGHALGFAHEFQREDRDDHVSLSFNFFDDFGDLITYNWNYGKMKMWANGHRNLSHFDHASIMNACYITEANDPACDNGSIRNVSFDTIPATPVRQYELLNYVGGSTSPAKSATTNLLSVDDINTIYRVYARALDKDETGEEFGHSVATGDFDNDGHEDIAVAATEVGSGSQRELKIYVYRGVARGVTVEFQTGQLLNRPWRHLPWLAYSIGVTSDADRRMVLAAGDFNGDKIDDLAVGDPGYDGESGRVAVVFFNQAWSNEGGACGGRACAPWGERSVLGHHMILPEDVGLDAGRPHRFGAALAVADITRKRIGSNERQQRKAEDLLIGAPGASEWEVLPPDYLDLSWNSSGAEATRAPAPGLPNPLFKRGGAVVMIRPNIMAELRSSSVASTLNWDVFDSRIVWNPGSSDAEFGASIGRIPSFCHRAENGGGVPLDGFAVGAPGESQDAGAVYYYDCAVGSQGNWMTPLSETGSHLHATAGHRYGTSVTGYEIYNMAFEGCRDTHYLVVGAPRHEAAGSSLLSGRVYHYEIDNTGSMNLERSMRPNTEEVVTGDDLFGATLAVHQEPSDTCTDEAGLSVGGNDVRIAIGMPGNAVDGNSNSGRVYIWNGKDDSPVRQQSSHVFAEARYGQSIATVRNLTAGGGFVIGAPGAFTGLDFSRFREGVITEITSGLVETVLNQQWPTSTSTWSSYVRVLKQSTKADSPPRNLGSACGLGFEAGLIVPLALLGRGLIARRRSERNKLRKL